MKKMRRMIPAFAMLMVAAIMLSTASFAWFTMSTEATATGMNVQAKASGSLVISDAPLTYANTKTDVDFKTATSKLLPMAWGSITYDDDDPDTAEVVEKNEHTGWYVPADSSKVDSHTGKVGTDGYEPLVINGNNKGNYYLEQEFYIGSAGDAQEGEFLTFTLAAPVRSDDTSSLAYTAAIYVITNTAAPEWADDATVAFDKVPDAFIAVDSLEDRNVVTLKGTATTTGEGDDAVTTYAGYTIPSIVGVGAQDNKTTGIKVIVRIFVDGNLESIATAEDGLKEVVTGYDYEAVTAGGAINPDAYYFFKNADNEFEPAVIGDLTTIPANWYIQVPVTDEVTYKYVNSDEVPTAASKLEITVSTVTPGN